MHTEWLYLPPLLNSITFTSFCPACPSPPFFFCRQLKGLLWDFVKCLCERFFGLLPGATLPTLHSPPSCNATVENIYTVLASGCGWECVCVCAGKCIRCHQVSQHFDAEGNIFQFAPSCFCPQWVEFYNTLDQTERETVRETPLYTSLENNIAGGNVLLEKQVTNQSSGCSIKNWYKILVYG